jgi:hypothetical protein
MIPYALAISVSLGTTAMVANNNRSPQSVPNNDARFASDAAFRDGLYVGRLAGERGEPQRIAVARWSTEQDRALFADGYRRGYANAVRTE